ncbi:hypothetical protein ACW5R3_01535 [Bizionia sp. KMM 8389]
MKKFFYLFGVLLFLSCSEVTDSIIENSFPDDTGLEVGIKNNTNVKFLRTEVKMANGNLIFQQIEPHNFSEFYAVSALYSQAEITIQTANAYYSFTPNQLDENTRVTEGRYYFEISIESPNNTLVITRKSF